MTECATDLFVYGDSLKSGVCDRGDFVKMYTTIASWKSYIFILNIHFLPSYCWVTYVAADSCLLVPQQQNVCVCLLWLLEPKTHHLIALITYGFLTFTEALPSVTAGYDSLTKWQHQSTFPRLSHLAGNCLNSSIYPEKEMHEAFLITAIGFLF